MKKNLIVLFSLLVSFSTFAIDQHVVLGTLKVEKEIEPQNLKNIIEAKMDVENPSDKNIEIELKLLHPQALDKIEKKSDISLDEYILNKDKVYSLKAKEKKTITIGLKLPEDFKGSRYVFYGFDLKNPEKNTKKSLFVMDMITYGQMTITVKGSQIKKAKITDDVSLEKDHVIVHSKIENQGNTFIRRISVNCIVQDLTGKLVGKYELKATDGSYLFQTNSRTYTVIIPKKLKGKFKFTYVYNTQDGDFKQLVQEEHTL